MSYGNNTSWQDVHTIWHSVLQSHRCVRKAHTMLSSAAQAPGEVEPGTYRRPQGHMGQAC